jgi:GTPase SAR1 family protein
MSPSIYVIAGPNGVGKTSFAREFLPNYADAPEPATPGVDNPTDGYLQRHDRQSFERKRRSICVIF